MGDNLLKAKAALIACAGAIAIAGGAIPASAQTGVAIAGDVHAGELAVPLNKSQVLRSDRPYAKALIGNPEIADVLPLTNQSLYVLGKKMGTTSLTLYDSRSSLIAVVDVVVGPDVISLRRQMSELMPDDQVGARISNDSIVLEGLVSSAAVADRAVQLANTYAPNKVVNLLSIGSAQQVMLEVRFSEIKRSAAKQIGFSHFLNGDQTLGAIGNGAGVVGQNPPFLGAITGSFAVLQRTYNLLGLDIETTLDALERKGIVTTLAEPTLVALSGETASFLAGGEFPVPVVQNNGGATANNAVFTVEWKPFGVSLAFTPTVLGDGVINLIVQPEVSSIDSSASITVNNQTIPGLQTRRAKTVVELRDGESFALAGLLRKDFQDTVRQFPILGSIPIIGTLFRSTGFQHEETELIIVVTPRLVRPVMAGRLKVPTDRVEPPNEADLLLLGRTDSAVPPALPPFSPAPVSSPPPTVVPVVTGGAASVAPSGFEKDYGHEL